MRNTFRFNELEKSRYTITVTVNGIRYELIETSLGSMQWELELNITYLNLKEELKTRINPGENKNLIQQYRNHLSTLNGFLTYVGKEEASRVGVELKSGFHDAVNNYLAALTITDRSKSDRRSHLNKWKATYDELAGGKKGSLAPPKFNAALRQAMMQAGISQDDLVESAHLEKTQLREWLKGKKPDPESESAIHRTEAALGLSHGQLSNLIPQSFIAAQRNKTVISFRQKLADRSKDEYRLKEDEISPELRSEWRDILIYKTSEYVTIERSKRGVWRTKPISECGQISEYACISGQGCPTAILIWGITCYFLGYLRRPAVDGGFGLKVSEAQTLAWFAQPAAVQGFLTFLKARSDGLRHHSHMRIASFVMSLTRPEVGYLWQQPSFSNKLPESFRSHGTWEDLCKKAYEVGSLWKTISSDRSRRPDEPIAGLLATEDPLAPVLRAITQLDIEAGACAEGPRKAALKRDALLLAFLLSNPLRANNIKLARYRSNNSGNIYKAADGVWRYRATAQGMKTAKPYDVQIASWLVPRLEEYLEDYRPVLIGVRSCEYFLPSSKGTGYWQTMNVRVSELTKRLIPETPGFGPHAFRPLVATYWLRNFPDDYLTVAQLLNDRIETVIKYYAHLRRDDSFSRYENRLLDLMSKVNFKN